MRTRIIAAVACLAVVVIFIAREDASPPSRDVIDSRTKHDDSAVDATRAVLSSELEAPGAEASRSQVAAESPTIIAPKAWVTVTVAAIDSHRVLEGIRVSAFDRTGQIRKLAESTPTDPRGRTELEVPSGIDLFIVTEEQAPNAGTVVEPLSALRPGERRDFDLYIHRGDDARVFIQVVSCGEEKPVENALVQVCRSVEEIVHGRSRRVDSVLHEERTDANGRCDLPYPSTRDPYVRVRVHGMGPVTLSIEEPGAPDRPHIVCVEPAATLVVEVVDASGAPVAEATVEYARSYAERRDTTYPRLDSREKRAVDWFAKTDTSGRAVIGDLPPNVWLRVSVVVPTHRNVPEAEFVALEPGEHRVLRCTLGMGCRIDGRIVDQENKPVARADVELRRPGAQLKSPMSDQRVTSDDEGRFAFDDVAPGAWSIELAHWSRKRGEVIHPEVAGAPLPIHVDSSSKHEQVLFEVHRGLFISGRVLDPDGDPSAVSVRASSEHDPERWSSTQSDAHGRFRIGPLTPGGYELSAGGSPTRVPATAGDTDVELRLREGGSLRVRVIDEATGRLEFAYVSITRRDADGFESRSAEDPRRRFGKRELAPGDYWATGLPAGRYDVHAVAEGRRYGELRDVTVSEGGDALEVTVELSSAADLRVRIGEPARSGSLDVVCGGRVLRRAILRRGEDFVCVVPAGTVTVRFTPTGTNESTERTIEMAARESRTLIFGDR